MGRRSQHTTEELRELILVATRRCVEDEGLDQPSAREIARAIGYAPGTLYNMFPNLSDILLRVEARILLELDDALTKAAESAPDADAVRGCVDAYVSFAHDQKRSWTLLCKHQPNLRSPVPSEFVEALRTVAARIESALERSHPEIEPQASKALAKQIWTCLHGLLQVAMTQKLGAPSRQQLTRTAHNLVDGLISVATSEVQPVPALQRTNGRSRAATPPG